MNNSNNKKGNKKNLNLSNEFIGSENNKNVENNKETKKVLKFVAKNEQKNDKDTFVDSKKTKKEKDTLTYREEKQKIINRLDKKIDDITQENFNEEEVRNILNLIEKEIKKIEAEKNNEDLINGIDNNQKNNIECEDISKELLNLTTKLLEKVSVSNPFESFLYSEEKEKEKIVKDFFSSIDKDIHLLDFDKIDFNSDYKSIIAEKNKTISSILMDTLEKNLNINFSEYQKVNLKKDFSNIALAINNKLDDTISECDKIKTVSNIKLIAKPSYKNFVSKAELRNYDPSKKISTIRINFLDYITLSKKEREKVIANNVMMQLKSIKEILEIEKAEINNKLKVLFTLIAISTLAIAASPQAGALGIITIGSAAAYISSKNIIVNNKINKVQEELESIKNNSSKIVMDTMDKLEEISKELMEDEAYSDITKLYIKKKKEALKEKELREKIEKQMNIAIVENLINMNASKKERMIERLKDKYLKGEEKSFDNDISKNIEKIEENIIVSQIDRNVGNAVSNGIDVSIDVQLEL